MDKNVIGWFEIPVSDMDRAIKFYETVFDFKIDKQQMGHLLMGFFPWIQSGTGSAGSLVYEPNFYKPSTDGTLIYFSSQSDDLSTELSKIESAGGKIIREKTLIAEDIGYFALFIDTEGNRIALHSRK